jgi:hypothetical protein
VNSRQLFLNGTARQKKKKKEDLHSQAGGQPQADYPDIPPRSLRASKGASGEDRNGVGTEYLNRVCGCVLQILRSSRVPPHVRPGPREQPSQAQMQPWGFGQRRYKG